MKQGSGKNLEQGGQVRDCGSHNDQIKVNLERGEGSIRGYLVSKGIDLIIQLDVGSKGRKKRG